MKEGVWSFIGRYYLEDRYGWLYVLLVMAIILLGLWSSYQCNLQLGLMFSMFEAHNLMGYYHCILMLSLSALSQVFCLFFMQVMMGMMRIGMTMFYMKKMLPNCSIEDAPIISHTIPQMTLQWMVIQELLELILKAGLYGYIVYTLMPDDPTSFFGFALGVSKPMFWMTCLYTLLLFTLVAIALHFYSQCNERTKKTQNDLNTNVSQPVDLKTLKNNFGASDQTVLDVLRESLHGVLKTYSAFSALLLLGQLSSTILPWMMVGYAFFQGMMPLSVMMQVCHALRDFMQTSIRFLEKARRLADFYTQANLCVQPYQKNQTSASFETNPKGQLNNVKHTKQCKSYSRRIFKPNPGEKKLCKSS